MQPEPVNLIIEEHRRLALTLRDVVAVTFRQRVLLLASFIVIFVLAVVFSGALLPTYKAEMKILVRRGRVDPVVTSQPNATQQVVREDITESELNSEVQLLNSQDLLRSVVLATGLQRKQHSWGLLLAKQSEEVRIAMAVRRLGEELKVEPLRMTNVISVTYESSDPQLSVRVLSSLASLYVEKHLLVHRPSGEFKFFDQETSQLRQGLNNAEARLTEFTNERGVVSAPFERDLVLQKTSELEAGLAQTKVAIAETEHRIQDLEQQAESIPPRQLTLSRSSDNPQLLQQMKSTLLELELKRTSLLSKYEPTYRPVQEVEKQISETRAAIAAETSAPIRDETTAQNPVYESVKSELSKARTDRSGLKARAAASQAALARYRETARALQQATITQQDLQRTAKTEEENYLLYLRKEEEARINDALDQRGILNVAIAEPPTVPVLPTRSLLRCGLLSLFLAGAASLGLAFTADFMNPSFRTPDEVLGYLESPVLASIPKNGN